MRLRICGLALLLASAIRPESFKASEVKVLGPIEYGETSKPIRYSGTPRFLALAFNGRPGDSIEVTVTAEHGTMLAYLTDAGFRSLAGGMARFSSIIGREGRPATYYILVAAEGRKPTAFRVGLERPSR